MPLLEVKDLTIEFESDDVRLPAVTGVTFDLQQGELLALVGESGCGKSVTCMSLAKLVPMPPAVISGGQVLLHQPGQPPVDVLRLSDRELRKVRGGGIAYIFQEPSVSLNPVFRVGTQIAEAIRLHRSDPDQDPDKEAVELLRQVGIPEPEARAKMYPHELSGGMQQRVMIAMGLACHPAVLVADEPTTALDVTIQAQILDLLRQLRDTGKCGIILVTHNLGIVAELANRVGVMYAGRIVEVGKARDVLTAPRHPYTRALIAAVPVLGSPEKELHTIRGSVPTPDQFPAGCRFFGRCSLADTLNGEEQRRCQTQVPELRPVNGCGGACACHFFERISKDTRP